MLGELLTKYIYLPIILWLVFWSLNRFLTIYSLGEYKKAKGENLQVAGSGELNDPSVSDIEKGKYISPLFVIVGLAGVLLILIMWFFIRSVNLPVEVLELTIGFILFQEIHAVISNLGSAVNSVYLAKKKGIKGKILYERWVMQRMIAATFFGFSALYLFNFALSNSFYFLGGMLSTAVLAIRFLSMAKKNQKN